MKRTVVVTREAEQDADTIFAWLTSYSPDGARRWYAAYLKALRKLEGELLACPQAPESEHFGETLYHSKFHTRQGRRYRLIFKIVAGEVHVLYVRGFGQDKVN
jgi:plasmid stabilization system protein ParE